MFAVFDGHIGDRTAKLCARLLPDIIDAYMKEGKLPNEALHDGFLKYVSVKSFLKKKYFFSKNIFLKT